MCFQSFLGLDISCICIQRHIIGNDFIQRLQRFFFILVTFFNVYNVFYLFERFFTSMPLAYKL